MINNFPRMWDNIMVWPFLETSLRSFSRRSLHLNDSVGSGNDKTE